MTSFSHQPDVILQAGATSINITPPSPVFLFGYPQVARTSTGVHDGLECAALYLKSGTQEVLFLANDLIFIPKSCAAAIRRRLFERTGIAEAAIMVTATHTHSGPVMVDYLSNAADATVPSPDPAYLEFFVDKAVSAGETALRNAAPAEITFALARGDGVGTNRHDPRGASDLEVPVINVRSAASHQPIACMLVCAMHPTVLHEDSTVISGDFPYFTRRYLQNHILMERCPVLFHQGASGNQSPRHVTRANTLEEAQRVGEILGRSVADALRPTVYTNKITLSVRRTATNVMPREFPSLDAAARRLEAARTRFRQLKNERAPRQTIRNAECDLFGAEETMELARAARDGRLASAVTSCLPAEIQAISLGPWNFIGWPGEFFVEYALELRRRVPGTFVITMANGDLRGYIATAEAEIRGTYESANAVFAPENGMRFVAASVALINGKR
jgi:neutral ceramidase